MGFLKSNPTGLLLDWPLKPEPPQHSCGVVIDAVFHTPLHIRRSFDEMGTEPGAVAWFPEKRTLTSAMMLSQHPAHIVVVEFRNHALTENSGHVVMGIFVDRR